MVLPEADSLNKNRTKIRHWVVQTLAGMGLGRSGIRTTYAPTQPLAAAEPNPEFPRPQTWRTAGRTTSPKRKAMRGCPRAHMEWSLPPGRPPPAAAMPGPRPVRRTAPIPRGSGRAEGRRRLGWVRDSLASRCRGARSVPPQASGEPAPSGLDLELPAAAKAAGRTESLGGPRFGLPRPALRPHVRWNGAISRQSWPAGVPMASAQQRGQEHSAAFVSNGGVGHHP